MSGFHDREKDFENKYAHDSEIGFKIEARAAKLLGLYVAEKIGLSGAGAQDYAMGIKNIKLENRDFEAVLKKIGADLTTANIEISTHRLNKTLDECRSAARAQIMDETR